MTERSRAAVASVPSARNSSLARVTAGNRNRPGRPAGLPVVTHTLLAPVTWPRWTRHSSPSSTWPAGSRPRLAAPAARTRQPQRPQLRTRQPRGPGDPAAPRRTRQPRRPSGSGSQQPERTRRTRRPARPAYQGGPAGRRAQDRGGHRRPARQFAQVGEPGHPAQPQAGGAGAGTEAGDGGGRRRVGERRDGRVEQVDRLAAERAEQQRADQRAVVHVQPLGRGDQHPGVARHRVQGGGQEEVNVQPGQAARGQALAGGGGPQPALPACRDLVVAHVWRIAQEQGGAVGRRQPQRPVVAERDARPAGHARRRERGPADHRGERVGLHPQQGCLRPAAAGGGEEPGRAGARVDDPGRVQGARGPADHALHHRPGGERLARRPPLGRTAQPAERLPQRILAGQNLAPDLRDLTLAGVSCGVGEALLRLRPAGHLGGPQPHRHAGQRRFRLKGDHAAHCGGPAPASGASHGQQRQAPARWTGRAMPRDGF